MPSRHRILPLAAALLVLGGGLSACSSAPEDTTCGEIRSMSEDDRVALLDDLAAAQGDDAAGYADLTDRDRTARAEALVTLCEGDDDGTTIGRARSA